ncbi:MAG: peptidase [Bacteroidetes bacterium]|nr:peptidase [Bacteroidota bacterium]
MLSNAQKPKDQNTTKPETNNSAPTDILKNPLVAEWDTPFQTPPFELIKLEHYLPAFEYALKQAKQDIYMIANQKSVPTFENTVVAMDRSGALLSRISNVFFNMLSANTSPELQKIAQEVSPLLTQHSNEIYHDKALFNRVKEVYKIKEKLEKPEDKMLLEKTYKAFINSGAELSLEDQEVYNNISMQLSKLSLQFSENVLSATNAFEVVFSNKEELKGLPENELAIAQEKAKAKGQEGYLFDLSAPSYGAIMKYADDRKLREKFYKIYNSRAFEGEFDNNGIIAEIVSLRFKLAHLMGFENYAEYALQDRMAENPKNVYNLLDQLLEVSYAAAKGEIEEITKYAQSIGFKGNLERWDFTYYSEKYKNFKFNISDEMVKPYFKLENVIDGVFKLTNKLYGITYKQNKKIQVYHQDVTVYEVYRNKNLLGILYLDFHPRASKRGGAWMTSFREQSIDAKGNNIRPLVSLVMNFTPSTPGNPSLLTYDEVTTFLHEFGHGLHGLLSNVTYESISGTSVPRDFVELPSQIMENFASNQEFLKLFAYHYKTKKLIPEETIQKLKDMDNYLSGYTFCRQLTFGYLDMMWHTLTPERLTEITEMEREAIAKTELLPRVDGTCISTAFSHIFAGGYAAGYYGYKWAEVLDADAFSYFVENGVYNKKIADSFVENILSKGGTLKAMDMYTKFRGREPQVDALLKRSGLKK